MSLDFTIIPYNETFIREAHAVQNKLTNITHLHINVIIDTNYHSSFSTRINKWKKQECDIITIDEAYTNSSIIVVRFYDNNSQAKAMHIDEFIDLVSSFEDDSDTDIQLNNDTNDTNNDAKGCIIT
jgi:hypothetical protein